MLGLQGVLGDLTIDLTVVSTSQINFAFSRLWLQSARIRIFLTSTFLRTRYITPVVEMTIAIGVFAKSARWRHRAHLRSGS